MQLSYTIFENGTCTKELRRADLTGENALEIFRAIHNVLGSEPREGINYPQLGIRITNIAETP